MTDTDSLDTVQSLANPSPSMNDSNEESQPMPNSTNNESAPASQDPKSSRKRKRDDDGNGVPKQEGKRTESIQARYMVPVDNTKFMNQRAKCVFCNKGTQMCVWLVAALFSSRTHLILVKHQRSP